MNIFQKLALLRTKVGVTKDGKNDFGKYKYYQIEDIYSEAKEVMNELGICHGITHEWHPTDPNRTMATLTFYCTEKPEETVKFSIPTMYGENKGMSVSQNYGSLNTYTNKYLFLNALMLDNSELDPDKNNGATPFDRNGMMAKFNAMPAEKIEAYKKAARVSDPKFLKNEILEKIAVKEGWM